MPGFAHVGDFCPNEACADYGKQQKNVELIPKMVKHGSPGREVTADGLNGCTMALDRTAYPCPSASC